MTPSPFQLDLLQRDDIFTNMCDKNMQLVKAIEKFPCLYNHNVSEYLKKDLCDKAWNEVARQTLLSVAECKEKWKNLRYGLLRSLRLNPDGTVKRKYYLHEEMEFVLPYIRTSKQTETALQHIDAETDEDISEFTEQDKEHSPLQIQFQEIEIPEPPKRKRACENFMTYLQRTSNNNNEVTDESRKMFLLSLLPEVNALTECQMRIFRRKMLLLLDEIVDSPSQYEMCLHQWQKESSNQEAQMSSENDAIKKEPL